MHYHIILTEKCNLMCTYCYGKSMEEFDNSLSQRFTFDFSEPCISKVEIERLKKFISKDPESVIIFYGGEPLLQIEKIKQIMDNIDVPYRMQTNGILLHLFPKEYLNRIGKILISIDGTREHTNKNRGEKTYEKIMKNISLIKENGYEGELIARMTISQDEPNVYEQVLDLIKNGFRSIHWQLDAGFYETDYDKKMIKDFFDKYNNSVLKLIDYWFKELEEGNPLMIYPFVGIIESLISGEPTRLRCGAGHSGYAISTTGKVMACPIMNSVEDFKSGDLETNPEKLKVFEIPECENCEVLGLCGGRCLYWRKAKLWPKEGDEMICNSIKLYIKKLQENFPKIKDLISKGIIKKEDFSYEKYFGPEIIP